MFEINLTCPECGCFEWDEAGSGVYECQECGRHCTFEQMEPQVFQA